MRRVAKKGTKPSQPQFASKTISSGLAEARSLLAIVEKSQVPFGEPAPLFARLKTKIDSGKSLSVQDYEHLLRLVNIAKDWNKAEDTSALTEPEDALSG